MSHRALSQEELVALADGDRAFEGVLFSSVLDLNAIGLSEATFTGLPVRAHAPCRQ